MTDNQTTEKAVEAFHNLSGDDTAKLKDLNTRIQSHKGKWGVRRGGEKIAENTIQESWVENNPLISELIFDFMLEKGLLIHYVWDDWNDSLAELFESQDQTKYDNIDLRTALILVGAAVRKDRVASGSIAWAFESGGFPKLVNRLVALGAKRNE